MKHIEEIARILGWKEPCCGILHPMLEHNYKAIEIQLRTRLLRSQLGQAVLRLWPEIPKEIRSALISAPSTRYMLKHAKDVGIGNFVWTSIVADLRRQVGEGPLQSVWTAGGDFGWDKGGREIAAARTSVGFPVDFHSPFTNIRLSEGWREDCPKLSGVEQKSVMDKIDIALKLIETISQNSLSAVHSLTKVVIVYKWEEVEFFSSASAQDIPGRTDLVNPHIIRVTPAEIADSLVHETIHHLLYEFEEQSAEWPWDERSDLIRSPWTGRELDFETFIHAYFVWYGLFHFWEKAPTQIPEASLHLERSSAGFLNADPALELTSRSSGKCKGFSDTVDHMQNVVRDIYRGRH